MFLEKVKDILFDFLCGYMYICPAKKIQFG